MYYFLVASLFKIFGNWHFLLKTLKLWKFIDNWQHILLRFTITVYWINTNVILYNPVIWVYVWCMWFLIVVSTGTFRVILLGVGFGRQWSMNYCLKKTRGYYLVLIRNNSNILISSLLMNNKTWGKAERWRHLTKACKQAWFTLLHRRCIENLKNFSLSTQHFRTCLFSVWLGDKLFLSCQVLTLHSICVHCIRTKWENVLGVS